MTSAPQLPPEVARTLEEVEREHVLAVLEACGGKIRDAADILGVDRKTISRWLRRWGHESR